MASLNSGSSPALAQYAGTQEARWKYGAQPSLLVGHVPTGGAVPNDYVRVRLTPEGRLEVVVDPDSPVLVTENAFSQVEDVADFEVTTPGTAENLAANPCKAVLLVAPVDNAGAMYWGFSSSSANKPVLAGGHALLPVADADLIWVDGVNAGDKLHISIFGPE